jgi:hypothetical protein
MSDGGRVIVYIYMAQHLQLTLQKNDNQHTRKEINSSGTIRLTNFEQHPQNYRAQ